jgi:hypothetical protein
MLTQLLYFSEVRDLGPGGAGWLLEQARAKNKLACLTGVLLFNQDYFVQCLEGGREKLTDIFGAIAADDRHAHVTLMSVHDIAERDFPDWSMGFVSSTTALRTTLLRFFPSEEFKPGTMSSASVTALMKCLRSMEYLAGTQ